VVEATLYADVVDMLIYLQILYSVIKVVAVDVGRGSRRWRSRRWSPGKLENFCSVIREMMESLPFRSFLVVGGRRGTVFTASLPPSLSLSLLSPERRSSKS